MNVLEQDFVQGFIRMCTDGFYQGWHERNGGNLSYRIRSEEIIAISDQLDENGAWVSIGTIVPSLKDELFLVTGSGKYFRNIELDPQSNLAIIKIDKEGRKYQIQWGLVSGGKPTSELPSHLLNHAVKKACTEGLYRVVYHAHTTNIIALTFILPLTDEIFTRELWEMATECPVVFSNGIGVVPWMVPGGVEIAMKTAELMKTYDAAIWAHHGMFATGETFDSTFGLIHTVEKAAEILLKVLSIRPDKRQTIEPEQFRQLAVKFNVELPDSFLFKKEHKNLVK